MIETWKLFKMVFVGLELNDMVAKLFNITCEKILNEKS